ncbi:MAG: hypothetical protein GXP16_14280, partial [Gammaproteobacteria bacterium]|nr:hypothetical protein [Gammaproteobacteria bacterium]
MIFQTTRNFKRFNQLLCSFLVLILYLPSAQGVLSDGSDTSSDYKGIFAIGSVWSFVSIFDFDTRRVTPAIIDIGITHGQTRQPGNACMINYQVGPLYDVSCNSSLGAYEGIMNQTVPEDSSSYRLHGTRMKNRIAALINDSGNDVGIAGQVAVPNLYQMQDVHGFLFELNTAITRAVNDGSSVINISAGLPCQLLWNTEFSPDICTLPGRAAYCITPFTHGPPIEFDNSASLDEPSFTNYLLSLTPVMKSLLCTAAGVAVFEGDLRQNMLQATLYAEQRGVPIVASAGNLWGPVTLNPQTDETIDLTPEHLADVSDWKIIPATLRGVIAVGAVDHPSQALGYPNADFHGDRVDIWAPSNDTSPAAAFVSGVITVAQAINPTLDPTNPALSSQVRMGITNRVRSMLQSTAFTSAHPQVVTDSYRRNLINPYGFIRAAAADRVPAFESLGYAPVTDDLLTDNGEIYPQNSPFWRMSLGTAKVTRAGSIVFVPGSRPYVDTDEFQLSYPRDSGPFAGTLDLYYLQGYGDLKLTTPDGELTLLETRDAGVETRRRYRVQNLPAGARLRVTVRGVNATDDNLYRLVASIEDKYDGPMRVQPDTRAEV